ncbi:5-(carboxyamino)imidazole ribonucleotide synthase [Rubrivirga sp.]|uniref:5-(carboxyamino)imidazole ribonucleotide synthase n=1 Tax=Rubrivirga sp. TaxID=1885344 RepID=UPI003B51BF2E
MSSPVLGILGGGQLGRMTALAATRLGVAVRVLADAETGTGRPFDDVTIAEASDPAVLRDWAHGCDVVTVESEWAPADLLLEAAPGTRLEPGVAALAAIRHKGRQRRHLAEAGLPQPRHVWAETRDEAQDAVGRFGAAVLKRFEGSYDGYGNATCRTPAEVDAAWDALSADDGLLVEAFVPFQAEAAVTVARRPDGEAAVYPVVRSEHRDHRLWAASTPAGFPDAVEAEARRVALATVAALDVTGVATVELFVLADGVLVNEVAPRPHNTAHLTIDASHTSQFENHVRAVLGWPLGDPGLRVPAACMVNVLGQREGPAAPDLADALAVPGASVHLYGKAEVRPERKMGHVTVTAGSVADARRRAEAAATAVRL